MDEELQVFTLNPDLEQILQKSLQTMSDGGAAIEPGLASRLLSSLRSVHEQQELAGKPSVLLVPDELREFLARLIRHSISSMNVLAFSEVPESKQLKIVATVGGEDAAS